MLAVSIVSGTQGGEDRDSTRSTIRISVRGITIRAYRYTRYVRALLKTEIPKGFGTTTRTRTPTAVDYVNVGLVEDSHVAEAPSQVATSYEVVGRCRARDARGGSKDSETLVLLPLLLPLLYAYCCIRILKSWAKLYLVHTVRARTAATAVPLYHRWHLLRCIS